MKKQVIAVSAALTLVMAGCASEKNDQEKANVEETGSSNHMEGMNHSSDGTVPAGLQEAKNPAFPVGSEVNVETDHMEGMKDAAATVVGAYDTTAYVITYTPTTGGDEVNDHKWVIQEELDNPPANPVEDGATVTVLADHMEGMKGAEAVIESSEDTTVYMIDYKPTDGGKEVKNHKWVTEDELSEK